MDKDTTALYKWILDLAPYKENKDANFRTKLRVALKNYRIKIGELKINDTIKIEIARIIVRLLEIVDDSIRGLHSRAYTKFQNLIYGNAGLPARIKLKETFLHINPNADFYRIRLFNQVYDVSVQDLFHIPLNKRGIVKTQRFSFPGYPCLYLGESIYGCWEEMHRPPMYSCAVSRFSNTQRLNFIDLRVSTAIERLSYNSNDTNILKLMPLIIACMIPVENYEDTFKPEYIIPQLLIEWVLKCRDMYINEEVIHGIAYTSTHISNDFNFPYEKNTNYAIPIFKHDTSNLFCSELCSLFNVTKPTTNDIEKLKREYHSSIEEIGLPEEKEQEQNYEISDFGNLETRLKDTTKFPLYTIDPKQGSIKKAETPNDK